MRRLRAFLSAGRFARGAGVAAPARRVVAPGGVGRREMLGFVAAAPVLVPVALRTHLAARHLPVSVRALFPADLSTMTYGDVASGLAATSTPAVQMQMVEVLRGSGMALRPEDVALLAERARADAAALGLWAPAFIDDVGGGP